MVYRIFLIALLTSAFSGMVGAQPPAESGEQYLKDYDRRIKKEYLNDIYIPKDITDAFKELMRLTEEASIAKFKQADEEVVVRKLYFSLGRWISVNWGFYGGSRLSHWLKTNVGVSHPEDQAMFIIRTFHRSLNGKELAMEELAKELNEARRKERVKHKEIIKTEKRKVETDK